MCQPCGWEKGQNTSKPWTDQTGTLTVPQPLTSLGRPWILKMWSTTTRPVSLAEGNLGRRMKWAALENNSIALGGREASDKVQDNTGPGATGDGQKPQQTSGRLVRSFVLGANWASSLFLAGGSIPLSAGSVSLSVRLGDSWLGSGLEEELVTSSSARPIVSGESQFTSTHTMFSAKFPRGPTSGRRAWEKTLSDHSMKLVMHSRSRNPLVWVSRDCCSYSKHNSWTASKSILVTLLVGPFYCHGLLV